MVLAIEVVLTFSESYAILNFVRHFRLPYSVEMNSIFDHFTTLNCSLHCWSDLWF